MSKITPANRPSPCDDVLAALQKTKKHDPKHDTPLSGQAPD